MNVIKDISSLRIHLNQARKNNTIAFVPTMGNLHQGHLQIIKFAKQQADLVVVSIFVNPLQFAANEDFTTYPRTLEHDLIKLSDAEVNVVFTPKTEQLLTDESFHTKIIVPEISEQLCGQFRPQHFEGVATIVLKLFNIIQPDVALFGEKDFQQFVIIRKMVEDLCLPITVLSHPTVRESDGLALSSRNQYLTTIEKKVAKQLYQTLQRCRELLISGDKNQIDIIEEATQFLTKNNFKMDYISLCKRKDLQPPGAEDRELILLAAGWLGKTRLIDNIFIDI